MKYRHIIGLDIGTNSLGWCLIKEYEDGHIETIKSGVHIFPIGTIVDDKSNNEKTKNEQRRIYRGASCLRAKLHQKSESKSQRAGPLGDLRGKRAIHLRVSVKNLRRQTLSFYMH